MTFELLIAAVEKDIEIKEGEFYTFAEKLTNGFNILDSFNLKNKQALKVLRDDKRDDKEITSQYTEYVMRYMDLLSTIYPQASPSIHHYSLEDAAAYKLGIDKLLETDKKSDEKDRLKLGDKRVIEAIYEKVTAQIDKVTGILKKSMCCSMEEEQAVQNIKRGTNTYWNEILGIGQKKPGGETR